MLQTPYGSFRSGVLVKYFYSYENVVSAPSLNGSHRGDETQLPEAS